MATQQESKCKICKVAISEDGECMCENPHTQYQTTEHREYLEAQNYY